MFGFNQAHHQTLSRAAKQTIDNIAHVLASDLAPADNRLVEISAVFQVPFYLALAMQDVEHSLDSGVSEIAGQLFLHGLHVGRPNFPKDVHNLQFERRQMLGFWSGHQVSTPKSLGG